MLNLPESLELHNCGEFKSLLEEGKVVDGKLFHVWQPDCRWNSLVNQTVVDFIVFLKMYSIYCEIYVLSLKLHSDIIHVEFN